LLIPVTLDAEPVPEIQPVTRPAEDKTHNVTCEETFRHSTLRLNGDISENLLTALILELKL
jgi:transposase